MKNRLASLASLSLLLLLLAAPARAEWRVLQKVKVGGDGGWDYLTVDSAARRLYVTRGTHVAVFDADTLAPVGDIPDTQGAHGVAMAPALKHGFVSDGRAGAVTVFDLKTLKTLSQVKVTGENPDAILYDDATGRVFTFNGRGRNATAIDAGSEKVIGTIPLDGKPEFAASDLRGHVFVNIEDKSEVAEIDSKALTVLHRWPLAPCEEPSGMAIDREHGRLFIGCANRKMAVMDTSDGKIVATPPIGEGVDANAFDAARGLAFSSNGDGTLTVVREDSASAFSVVAQLPTQRGARTMALDEKTHRVVLVTAEFGPAPAPTAAEPRPRPPMLPGSFTILVAGDEKP